MDGSVGEQQMIVIRRSSGFDHIAGECIGDRDVIELRSGRRKVDTVLIDRRFQRQTHAIFAMLADRA